MATEHRCLMIGAGGMAGAWLTRFLPAFGERLRVAGLVDVAPAVLHAAADRLDLPAAARFTAMGDAFAAIDAGRLAVDCCLIVVPPRYHRPAAEAAAARGLAILSEKPIADTWADVIAIARAVAAAGTRMQVVQNYRYTTRVQTLKGVLDSGRLGPLHYLVGRFAADYRRRLAWGAAFRHEMRHPLLIEGAIHHLDQLRHLSGADCAAIAGWEWLPPAGRDSFKGECLAQYVLRLTDGTRASYEGNGLAGGWQNTWHHEYYRAECAGGAVVVDRDDTVRVEEWTPGRGLRVEEVPPVALPWEGHQAIIAQFLDWLDGGPAPPTVLADNLKSAAMLFAAIEASAEERVVDVAAKVATVAAPDA
jgi:predicted dehydrogenase